jgi:dihydrofolate reductase
MIVAVAENMAIGKNNELLWHIPADLKRFKAITTGHTVVMGRNTWLSLPKRPLKDRRNIVITDQNSEVFEGCVLVASVEEAMAHCHPDDESFIIGGASVYRQCLPLTDRLYLTKVHKVFEGDVFFPEIDMNEWNVVSEEIIQDNAGLGFSYSNLILNRRK